MDIEQQRRWGKIGGLTAHGRHGPETMLRPALDGFRRRFEREADPESTLTEAERVKRADRLRRAHMLALAARSAAVRRARKTASEISSPEAVRGGRQRHADDPLRA